MQNKSNSLAPVEKSKKSKKSKKSQFRRFLSVCFAVMASISGVYAQTIDDLDVVWEKTYEQGNISNIKHNDDGSYTACGYAWKNGVSTKYERLEGLVIEFDESGNELRKLTARIPQYYIDAHPGSLIADDAFALFNAAFKTVDGGFLAFGTFYNSGAPIGEKEYSWYTNDFANSNLLTNGIWIVKFDIDGNITKDTLVRGRNIVDAWATLDNPVKYVIGGFDTGTTMNSSLIRRYDKDGDLDIDKLSEYGEISVFRQNPDGSFIVTAMQALLSVSANLSSITANTTLILSLPETGNNPWTRSIAPVKDGGVFLTLALQAVANDYGQTFANGNGIYKINAAQTLPLFYKTTIPGDTMFHAPLLLPGNSNPPKYVGTAAIHADFYYITENLIYELTDNGTSFTYRTGATYPDGTALKTVSQVDGFFSCGSNASGQAAIAKLSTCANFKLDVGATDVTYQGQGGSFTFPGRTVAYSGQNGSVSVSWTLNDVTQGGPATDVTTVSDVGVTVPSRTFTLQPGKNFAMLRYTVTAVDTYMASGVPKTCQQTQTILIRIYREFPDNIIDAKCFVEPQEVEWGMAASYSNEHNLSPYQSVVVGDIDGDGVVEIIAVADPAETVTSDYNLRPASNLAVYKGNSIKTPPTLIPIPNKLNWDHRAKYGLVKTPRSGKDTVLIVVAEYDRYLRAYKYDETLPAKYAHVWTSSARYHASVFNGLSPAFADFNHDGIPEIAIGEKLFNSSDGSLICSLTSAPSFVNYYPSMSVQIADVFNSGSLNYTVGNCIYDVNVDPSTGVIQSMTLNRKINPPAGCSDGGRSLFVDMDRDGRLDFIAAHSQGSPDNKTTLYIADPAANTIKASVVITPTDNCGYPFVGDVDGDGNNEISLITGYGNLATGSDHYIRCYKYVTGNNALQEFWKLPHRDQSNCTGLTMFDFDQDGRSEIVYRDEFDLRIIDGRADGATNPSLPPERNKASEPNISGTSGEYPVVADVDGDGQAEIIIVGGLDGDSDAAHNGRLWIYKSNNPATSPWAPARKVWNQYAYHPLYVNEDLSIPTHPLNPATFFQGPDGISGNSDDIQPYNNYLQQQTTLNANGTPFMLAPNAEFDGSPIFAHYADGDSLVITVQVKNSGEAGLQPPLYISAFKNEILPENQIATDSCMTAINPNETKPVTVTVRNLSTHTFDKIIISLNTKDGSQYAQAECDYASNEEEYGEDNILRAYNDHAATIITIPIKIPVLANDSIPSGCAPTVSVVAPFAVHGDATVVNDSVQYTVTDPDFVGYDTVTYSVSCNGNTSTAKVYVQVHDVPDNVTDADCVILPQPTEWNIREVQPVNTTQICNYGLYMVGDIDGDDTVEIIAYGPRYLDDYGNRSLEIFKFDGQLKWKSQLSFGGTVVTDNRGSVAMTRYNGEGYVFVPGRDGYIYAYRPDGTPHWKSKERYNTAATNAANIGIADFNNDGIPEIYAGNSIYSIITGDEICTGGSNNRGIYYYYGTNIIFPVMATVAADIYGDEKLELLAGTQIYEVDINSNTMTLNPEWQLPSTRLPAGVSTEGQAIPVDIDGDGILEIAVISHSDASAKDVTVLVWKPKANYQSELVGYYTVTDGVSTATSHSTPMIANIDNTPTPEIVFITNHIISNKMYMFALSYDKSQNAGQRIVEKWKMDHTDGSGATGATMFDFNRDGIAEIVYRDEDNLYIIDGSGNTAVKKETFNNIKSNTVREYPVIADIDGDEQAEIIIAGNLNSKSPTGYLRILKAGAGTLWSPARKVWNQYMYNSINVNEDLTVPAVQFSPAIVFPGSDELLGTADDLRPYNNFLQQQTYLSINGTPFWLAPDAKFDETADPVFTYYGYGDSLVISMELTNIGDAALSAPFYISAYANTVAAANKMATDSSMISLNVEDTIPAKVTVRNFSSYTSLNSIIIRINDKGAAAYIQPECDYSNNVFEYSPAVLPRAFNDTVAMLTDTEVIIDVKLNDVFPSGCSPVPAIKVAPLTGNTATIEGDKIKYTPATDFYGVDSLVYRVNCTSGNAEAKVYIIVAKPLADTYTGCSGSLVKAGFEIISDVTYRWYANQTDPADNAILWQETNDWPAPSDLWVEVRYRDNALKPRFNVRIDAYPVLTAGSIEADDTVCYSTVPEKLVSVSPAGGGNGEITYQWQYSEDSGENWHNINGETSEDYTPAAALTQTAWYRRQAGNDCGTVHTDSVKITVYPQSLGNYPDLRIRVCPDAGASVNLSKYIDSFAVTSILWESVSPPVPIINTESGTVSANSFSPYASVYTLAYTVSNPCAVDIRRRVYLETLKPDRMRPLRDTVRICYEHAEAVQINQLFGIDARGTWKYYSVTDNDVDSYVTESTSPVYGGAVVMNGKDIYQDPSIAFYGVDTKKVEFIYKTHNDSCLHGKEYKMVIILTPDIIK